MNKRLSNTEYNKRARMMFAVCRYLYCKHHNIESMSRDDFRTTLREKNISLPRVKEFIMGKHIEYKDNIFTIEEGHEELNSTMIGSETSSELNIDESINSAIFERTCTENQAATYEANPVSALLSQTSVTPIPSIEPIMNNVEHDSVAKTNCLGLNKTVEPEQIHWHVDKISDMRTKGKKRQFRVHWSSYNGKKFRPSWQNESNLNCSELLREFDPVITINKNTNKDDLEITRSEVTLINKKYKTNDWHISKRQ
jgi:hypothetical protein